MFFFRVDPTFLGGWIRFFSNGRTQIQIRTTWIRIRYFLEASDPVNIINPDPQLSGATTYVAE